MYVLLVISCLVHRVVTIPIYKDSARTIKNDAFNLGMEGAMAVSHFHFPVDLAH